MLQTVQAALAPALRSRLVLLVNHVLSRESAALERMKPHRGARVCVEVVDVPAWWPPLPALALVVTPAGLFEIDDADGPAALTLGVAAPGPAQWLAALAGDARPQVRIEGDAELATDMAWLVDNLRWDVESDLAALVGAAPAHLLAQVGRGAARALRTLAGTADAAASR